MSDSDAQDHQVLGKRGRRGETKDEIVNNVPDTEAKVDEDDDSDDDLGPMPLPAAEVTEGAKKKKRKSMLL